LHHGQWLNHPTHVYDDDIPQPPLQIVCVWTNRPSYPLPPETAVGEWGGGRVLTKPVCIDAGGIPIPSKAELGLNRSQQDPWLEAWLRSELPDTGPLSLPPCPFQQPHPMYLPLPCRCPPPSRCMNFVVNLNLPSPLKWALGLFDLTWPLILKTNGLNAQGESLAHLLFV